MTVDDDVRDRLSEHATLALTLYGEGRSEPVEGRIAIGCVVRNRAALSPRFGVDIKGVCLMRLQFSCWWPQGGLENYRHVMGLARGVVEGFMLPITGSSLAILQECQFLAEGLIGQQLRDNTRGADHYFAPAAMVPPGHIPRWAVDRVAVARIAGHLFFRLVA